MTQEASCSADFRSLWGEGTGDLPAAGKVTPVL